MVFAAILISQMVLEPVLVSPAQHRPLKRYRQKAVAALYSSTIKVAAKAYKIPEAAIYTLIAVESGWDTRAVSKCGAVGLTQLLPSTAREIGVDPWRPRQNIVGGAHYLAQQYYRFGTWELAFAAYNAGPGRVVRGTWMQIAETRAYVARALEYMESGEWWR